MNIWYLITLFPTHHQFFFIPTSAARFTQMAQEKTGGKVANIQQAAALQALCSHSLMLPVYLIRNCLGTCVWTYAIANLCHNKALLQCILQFFHFVKFCEHNVSNETKNSYIFMYLLFYYWKGSACSRSKHIISSDSLFLGPNRPC